MEEYRPVVVDKAKRALSLVGIQVPGKDETFFKAYTEENTPVLVPEASLEAMRNLVNLNIRRKKDSLYTKMPDMSSEKQYLNKYQEKLELLAKKLDKYEENDTSEYIGNLDSDYDDLELVYRKPEEVQKKSFKKRVKRVFHKKSAGKPEHLPEEESKQRANESETDSVGTSFKSEEDEESKQRANETDSTSVETSFRDAEEKESKHSEVYNNTTQARSKESDSKINSEYKTIKFCIYGYVRTDKQPVFIIQSYEGDSVLQRKNRQLYEGIPDDRINVFISAEFYPKNILEEHNNVPSYLTIGNRQIIIDKKSIIFQEGVTDALSTDELHIAIRGKFIKGMADSFYTPSLHIGVEIKRVKDDSVCQVKWLETNPVARKENLLSTPNIPTYTIKARGFQLFPTHTEGGVTIYESTEGFGKSNPDRTHEGLESFISCNEAGVYENNPNDNFRSTRSENNIDSKTVFGDAEADSAEVDGYCVEPLNEEAAKAVYECGSCVEVKSDNFLAARLSSCQSKTEYGDVEVDEPTEDVAGEDSGKLRNVQLLRKLNEIIFSRP